MSCKTLEELKKDLSDLERQALAISGAMQYLAQQIAQLEQKDKEQVEEESKEPEGGKT